VCVSLSLSLCVCVVSLLAPGFWLLAFGFWLLVSTFVSPAHAELTGGVGDDITSVLYSTQVDAFLGVGYYMEAIRMVGQADLVPNG
jgi:hypothetical protein